jgi:hypothetical protein
VGALPFSSLAICETQHCAINLHISIELDSATNLEVEQDGEVLTSVSATLDSVTVTYV